VRSPPRRTRPDERGVTLIELLVASVLTLVVMVIGYDVLSTTTRTVNVVTVRTFNSNNARVVVDSLEANLRYADGAWAPTSSSLAVSNASGTSSTTRQPRCALWLVTRRGLAEQLFDDPCSKFICRDLKANPRPQWAFVTSGSFTVLPPSTGPGLEKVDVAKTALAHHLVDATMQIGDKPNAVTVVDLVTPDNWSIAAGSAQPAGLC
jgi:prepilin-type N-terminal cleavage/methylation domain-containing protein